MAKSTTADTAKASQDKNRGPVLRYIGEVISELKKVTTPTRTELIGYFFGVLFFVAFMLLLISGLDWVFGQGAFWIFGNGTLDTGGQGGAQP